MRNRFASSWTTLPPYTRLAWSYRVSRGRTTPSAPIHWTFWDAPMPLRDAFVARTSGELWGRYQESQSLCLKRGNAYSLHGVVPSSDMAWTIWTQSRKLQVLFHPSLVQGFGKRRLARSSSLSNGMFLLAELLGTRYTRHWF